MARGGLRQPRQPNGPLEEPARVALAYLRDVGRPVSVMAAVTGARLGRAEALRALGELSRRGLVTVRTDPELGDVVLAVGR